MAYSKETWKRAKGLFLLGKSLSEIALECDIKDRTSILRRAKKEEWEKGKNQQLKTDIREFEREKSTLVAKKSTLVEKIATLEDYEVQILDEVIQQEEGIQSLLFSNAILGCIINNFDLYEDRRKDCEVQKKSMEQTPKS